ncbi:hypothetical protein, partial [Haloferax elongans]
MSRSVRTIRTTGSGRFDEVARKVQRPRRLRVCHARRRERDLLVDSHEVVDRVGLRCLAVRTHPAGEFRVIQRRTVPEVGQQRLPNRLVGNDCLLYTSL